MVSAKNFILLADRLAIPKTSKAILWDMDGVLIDSLGLDLIIVNEILQKYFGKDVTLSKEYIRSIFAYAVPDFWRMAIDEVARKYSMADAPQRFSEVLASYDPIRQKYPYILNNGVKEVISAARKQGLRQAVVSNTPRADLEKILKNAGFGNEFELLVGNDACVGNKMLQKKPAPDTYLFAVNNLKLQPAQCAVIEDSVIGVRAGRAAGCFVIGVATGGATEEELRKSGMADAVYSSFVTVRPSTPLGMTTYHDREQSSKVWDV